MAMATKLQGPKDNQGDDHGLTLALPRYELRIRQRPSADGEIEIWQLPAPATPHIKSPVYIAGLHGRNLALIEHRLLRRFKPLDISLAGLPLNDIPRHELV